MLAEKQGDFCGPIHTAQYEFHWFSLVEKTLWPLQEEILICLVLLFDITAASTKE